MPDRSVTLSVVSHGQSALVNELLGDIQRLCADSVVLVLTRNILDPVAFATGDLACPCETIANAEPKGFGANHNAAFSHCHTPYFCVVNPDVRFVSDPFPVLLETLQHGRAGVVGPLVRSPAGTVEDSARRFPTLRRLMAKAILSQPLPDYPIDDGPVDADWVAGMFMLFRSETFRAVGGFDKAYFLYYEDVDICERLWRSGWTVRYEPSAEIIHDARCASRKNFRPAMTHALSAIRFLSRGFGRSPSRGGTS